MRGLPIDADKEFTGNLFTLLNPVALLGGLVTLGLFLTHGALFVALKTDGPIRSDARGIATRTGVVTAVLAVVLLGILGVADGTVWSWATTVVAAAALVGALAANLRGREGWAFVGTFVTIAMAVATYFLLLFPDVMPSSTDAAWSLTTANASSTPYTLKIMTWVALVFTPIVLLYQSWTYWVFRKRIGTQHIPARREPLMRPFDPALLRAVPQARRPLGLLASVGVAQGVATIAHGLRRSRRSWSRWCGARPSAPPRHTSSSSWWCARCCRSSARRSRPRRGPRSAVRCASSCSARWLSAPAEERPTPGEAVTLASQGAASVEPYVARFLPALVTAAVVPALAVVTLAFVDWLSALVVRADPAAAAALRGPDRGDHPRRHRAPVGGAGRPVGALPRRGARAADPGGVRPGRAPGRDHRQVSQRHRRATMATLRLAFLSSAALELLATICVAIVAVTVGLRLSHGRSSSAPGCSRSCSRPRPTGRSDGSARSSTAPPTAPRRWRRRSPSSRQEPECRASRGPGPGNRPLAEPLSCEGSPTPTRGRARRCSTASTSPRRPG